VVESEPLLGLCIRNTSLQRVRALGTEGAAVNRQLRDALFL
jgi:hypothetical protein